MRAKPDKVDAPTPRKSMLRLRTREVPSAEVPNPKTGYLKAVWPYFWGCVFEVWAGPGPPGRAGRKN